MSTKVTQWWGGCNLSYLGGLEMFPNMYSTFQQRNKKIVGAGHKAQAEEELVT